MNVLTLIHQHPLLQADLIHQGLPYKALAPLAHNIALQLGSSVDNLSQVFATLTYAQCMEQLDSNLLAQESGISTPLAQSVLQSVATFIDHYEIAPTSAELR